MFISKKKLNEKLYETESKARMEEWANQRESRQNRQLSELNDRVVALEVAAGIKTKKSCGCEAVEAF